MSASVSQTGLSSPTEPEVSALTGFDPSRGGKLGETPILWRFKMQYAWSESLAEEHPDWDQCCTCWEFGVSESEARSKVWRGRFEPPCVRPIGIKECVPERYKNERDRELEEYWSASAIEARRAAAGNTDAVADESAAPQEDDQ